MSDKSAPIQGAAATCLRLPPGMPAELCLLHRLLAGPGPVAPPPGIGWPAFLALAEYHRVAPSLSPEACAALPAGVRAALSALRRSDAIRGMALLGELARIARGLDQAGIPWLCLKGPALASLLTGDPLGRTFRDIDLLVPPESEGAALAVLRDAGYAAPARDAWDCQTELHHAGPDTVVELHVALFDNRERLPLRLLEPFARATPVPLAGRPVPTLPLPEALVLAAVHGMKHYWRRLSWLRDMALAAANPAVDWDAVLAVARRTGTRRHLAGAMLLAQARLGAPLPGPLAADTALMRRAARAIRPLDRLATLPMPEDDAEARRHFGLVRTVAWDMALQERPRAAWASLSHAVLPTPHDRAALGLPRALAPLYLVARPLRLALKSAARRREA